MTEAAWGVEVFNRDAAARGGYVYTAGGRLSSRLATERSFELILGAARFAGRNVLDVGCGDGHFTRQLWDRARPARLTALDAAPAAVAVARAGCGGRPIDFHVADAAALPFARDAFDVALLQSILHHAERPEAVVREALRVAPEVVIHEPNGLNPGLKVIEKVSRYHREHGERSFRPGRVGRWVRQAGGAVAVCRFAGFVPMFCPDRLARMMKRIEPVLERTPVVRALGCAVCILVARRSEGRT